MTRNTRESTIDAALRHYIREKLGARLSRLAKAAHLDLWYGPLACDCLECEQRDEECTCGIHKVPWPGFVPATDEISAALEGIGTLWVDAECEPECAVSEREPEGFWDEDTHEDEAGNPVKVWVEPFLEETWRLEPREWKCEVFAELGEYV